MACVAKDGESGVRSSDCLHGSPGGMACVEDVVHEDSGLAFGKGLT